MALEIPEGNENAEPIWHISGNNSYIIENLDDGKFLLSMIIDEEFLTAETTRYPILIDPSFKRTVL